MREKVTNPVLGQVYMATRHYNSKRIVAEPFRLLAFNPPNPQTIMQYPYGGEWVMDGRKTSVSALYLADPKWVNRKIQEIVEEVARLNVHAENLRALLA